MSDEPYVVVTTSAEAGRGVFAGYLESRDGDKVTLRDGRNCVYWSREIKGFLGLAATGPSAACRIGPAAPQLELVGVTSIAHCSPQAKERWEAGPWNA